MCGICAYLGYEPGGEQALYGIHMLLNRGYDSAGFGYCENGKLIIHKYASTEKSQAIDLLEQRRNDVLGATNIIMHTRSHGLSRC